MTKPNLLKMFAFYFIAEQDELPSNLKIDILQELKYLNDYELMSMIMYGSLFEINERNKLLEDFIESSPGQVFISELDSKDYEKLGYAAGRSIKAVGNVGKFAYRLIGGTVKTAKYVGKGLWKIGSTLYPKSGLPGKPVGPGGAAKYTASGFSKGLRQKGLKSESVVYEMNRQKLNSKLIAANESGKILAWTAVPALALAVGYKLYKRHIGQAKDACKNKQNPEECVRRYKQRALKAQIDTLQDNRSKCMQSNDPQKCAEKIDTLINKKQDELNRLIG